MIFRIGFPGDLLLLLDKVVEGLLSRAREVDQILQPQTLRSGKRFSRRLCARGNDSAADSALKETLRQHQHGKTLSVSLHALFEDPSAAVSALDERIRKNGR